MVSLVAQGAVAARSGANLAGPLTLGEWAHICQFQNLQVNVTGTWRPDVGSPLQNRGTK